MEWIVKKLQQFRDDTAFILDNESVSYEQLCCNIEAWQAELTQLNIQHGETIAIIGDYSPRLVSLFIALILNNNIIVPLTSETRAKHAGFFSLANVIGCFEFSDSNEKWSFARTVEGDGHQYLSLLKHNNEAGIVLFTSGTTGKSKGAVIQVSKLFDKFNTSNKNVRRAFKTLVFLKLDHIGGINTVFAILFNGGTAISEGDRSPKSVCSVIAKYNIELLPTTPTFLNMLLISGMHREYDLSSLKMITYGTEPMPKSTLKAMNDVFVNTKFKQTYGLTELGIFSTKSKDTTSDWVKIGGEGVKLKVVDDILYIKTKTAMLGYLNAPSPFTEDGWYNTGDRVEVDGDYYRILGRESEIINVGGEKVYPAEVESVLLEIDNVKEALVQGKQNPVTGQLVMARLVLHSQEDSRNLQRRVIQFCNTRLEAFKVPKLVMISKHSFVSDRLKKARNI